MQGKSVFARGRLAVFATLALVLAACSSAAAGTTTKSSTGISTGSVSGLGSVFTSNGMTLYGNTKETNGTIVCTGQCAVAWPPVIVHGALPEVPGTTAMGSWGTVKRPDGTMQLTFTGIPLYTYAGDTAPGQATGQGLQGIWFAVGPSGWIKTMVPAGSSSGSSSGGLYGGGSSGSGGSTSTWG